MKTIQYISTTLAVAALTTFGISAQDLNKEISIDKDIVPELNDAERISVNPAIPQLKIKNVKLNYNEKAKLVETASNITLLDPANNVDTMKVSPYRGYAMLGYFPIYNLDFTAGYKIIDKKDSKLNAWVEYNGMSYDATSHAGNEMSIYDHEVNVDLNFAQRIKNKSILTLNADYAYNHFNCPWWGDDYTQNVNQFNFAGTWQSSIEGLKYNVAAHYGLFDYGRGADFMFDGYSIKNDHVFDAVTEHVANIEATAALELSDASSIGLDLGFDLIHNNHALSPSCGILDHKVWTGYKDITDYTRSVLTVTPHYDLKWRSITAKLGAQVDFQFDLDTKVRVAPDVHFSWDATKYISANVSVVGGIQQNSLSKVFDVSHYFIPAAAYGNSNLPLVIDAGVNFGPFENATIKVSGGYAIANDWYMPTLINKNEHIMNAVDIDGWYLGVSASYRYKDWGKINASYTTAPQQAYDKGYFMWRDRAKHVVNASLVVTPIKPLDIMLEYEYRGSRSSYMQSYDLTSDNKIEPNHTRLSLGQVNTLSLGGLYRFTDQLSFFARLENLFNHKYDLLYDIPSQGFTGLVGATYKF